MRRLLVFLALIIALMLASFGASAIIYSGPSVGVENAQAGIRDNEPGGGGDTLRCGPSVNAGRVAYMYGPVYGFAYYQCWEVTAWHQWNSHYQAYQANWHGYGFYATLWSWYLYSY